MRASRWLSGWPRLCGPERNRGAGVPLALRIGGGAGSVASAAMADLQATIEEYWERRAELDTADPRVRADVVAAIDLLDRGEARVAEVDAETGDVVVHQWLKQAILLLFRTAQMSTTEVGPYEYADKIPLKRGFADAGVRAVPGAIARWGSFHEPGVILMPSYTNIGARVGADTMVDTWATVGSCAQIGARTHLAGGVGIGGVLEPPQADPVVVGDDVFIGSRCMITEGSRIGDGAVVASGMILNGSTPVIDATTGDEMRRGAIPAWTVALFATRSKTFAGGDFGLPCALIVKRLEPGVRHDKGALNDDLREFGVTLG